MMVIREMENKHFQSAQKKASSILKDKDRLQTLLANATKKLKNLNLGKISFHKLSDKLQIIIRITRAYINGRYKVLPWKSLLILVAALLYFVMPLDLIPDIIPVTGFIDDFTVILWVFRSLQNEIEAFLTWENS